MEKRPKGPCAKGQVSQSQTKLLATMPCMENSRRFCGIPEGIYGAAMWHLWWRAGVNGMRNGKTAQVAIRERRGFTVSDEITGNYAMYGEFPGFLRDSGGHLWGAYVTSMAESRHLWSADHA